MRRVKKINFRPRRESKTVVSDPRPGRTRSETNVVLRGRPSPKQRAFDRRLFSDPRACYSSAVLTHGPRRQRPSLVVVDASGRVPAAAAAAALRITPGQRVARVAGRTRARGHAVARVALGVHAALARAHVLALVVDARLVVPALRVRGALAAPAPRERVAHVAGHARAHRPLLAGVVVPGLAPRVLAARVRLAQVRRLERPAPDERVARHGPRAAAYGRRAPRLAVGVRAAHAAARARVHAPFAQARRTGRRAVGVRRALGAARHVRVAEMSLRATIYNGGQSDTGNGTVRVATAVQSVSRTRRRGGHVAGAGPGWAGPG